MSRIENSPCDPKLLSPLALAFVGDGVYDLFVRERLVCEANRPVKKLNEEKVSIVRCSSQAKRWNLQLNHTKLRQLQEQ